MALKRHDMRKLISRKYQVLGGCKRDVSISDAKNCVYFITDGHYVKIGVASDLGKRLAQLQTGNPNKLSVKCVIEFGSKSKAQYYENKLHKYFESKHQLGEWFNLIDEDILLLQKDFDVELSRVIDS